LPTEWRLWSRSRMIWIIPDSDNERITGRVTARRRYSSGYLEYAHCFSPAPITSIGNAVLIVGHGFGAKCRPMS
jgi:hypothetical protein